MALPYFKPQVHQDERFYYVKIHPCEKEIAKEIQGRSWDGEISRWVYPKNPYTYQNLCKFLKDKAESFDISEPFNDNAYSADSNNEKELATLQSNDSTHEKKAVQSDSEATTTKTDEAIKSIGLAITSQSLCLEEIKEYIKNLGEAGPSNHKAQDALNPSKPEDCSRLDYFLLQVLSYGCKKSESEEIDWILQDFSLNSIVQFVTRKHEIIKDELRLNILLEETEASFPRIVHTARGQGAYINTREGSIDLYGALLTMNNIRNNLAHPDPNTSRSRVILMGLLYSLLLVEVWSHIAP